MGTTALTLLQLRFSGWFALLYSNMKCFVLSSLLSLSLAAPAPEAAADADAALIHPLLVHHAFLFAVVPAKQLQWPGVSAPGLDATCFGCRSHVLVPAGRKRRSAEAEAEAEAVADASPEAEAEAEAAAAPAPFYPLPVAPYYPYGFVPAVALRSSSYAAVNHAGVAYNTGVHSVNVVPVGRKRRDADAEADADAFYAALNGYAYNLGSGNSFSAISSGPALPYAHGVPAYPSVYGYPYPYLG